MKETQTSLRPRLVLFGASNLTLLLPHLLRRGPQGLWVVHCGHGRALTVPSRFFVRVLPPAFDAPWCRSLQREELAGLLVMDVGLDLLYGASLDGLLGRLEQLLGCFPSVQPTVVCPPVETVRKVGRMRFELLRRVFFPGRSVDRQRLLDDLEALAKTLAAWAHRGSIHLVKLDSHQYGFDPIHVRAASRAEVARLLLSETVDTELLRPAPERRIPLSFRLHAWPERFSVAGVPCRRAQPCLHLSTGSLSSPDSLHAGSPRAQRSGAIDVWLR